MKWTGGIVRRWGVLAALIATGCGATQPAQSPNSTSATPRDPAATGSLVPAPQPQDQAPPPPASWGAGWQSGWQAGYGQREQDDEPQCPQLAPSQPSGGVQAAGVRGRTQQLYCDDHWDDDTCDRFMAAQIWIARIDSTRKWAFYDGLGPISENEFVRRYAALVGRDSRLPSSSRLSDPSTALWLTAGLIASGITLGVAIPNLTPQCVGPSPANCGSEYGSSFKSWDGSNSVALVFTAVGAAGVAIFTPLLVGNLSQEHPFDRSVDDHIMKEAVAVRASCEYNAMLRRTVTGEVPPRGWSRPHPAAATGVPHLQIGLGTVGIVGSF